MAVSGAIVAGTLDICLQLRFHRRGVYRPGVMKQNLRVSLGAVVLALATLAAMIFAWLNFVQRQTFQAPDDGVAWLDTASPAQAWNLPPHSPPPPTSLRPVALPL